MARKPTDYVQFKLRIRESLRRKIENAAAKQKHSANAEAVQRLSESFDFERSRANTEARDTRIVNLLIGEKGEHEKQVTQLILHAVTEIFLRGDTSWLRNPEERAEKAARIGRTVARAIELGGNTFNLDEEFDEVAFKESRLPSSLLGEEK
jgi:hypothetical protein